MDRYYEYTDRLNAPIEAFTHITNDHNFPILPHWHYFIECIYLTAGNLLVTCDENVYSLQPGDFIFSRQRLYILSMSFRRILSKAGLRNHRKILLLR